MLPGEWKEPAWQGQGHPVAADERAISQCGNSERHLRAPRNKRPTVAMAVRVKTDPWTKQNRPIGLFKRSIPEMNAPIAIWRHTNTSG